MTTTVKVQSHNHPARVEIYDNGKKTEERVLRPEDGEVSFYTTTTRELRIVDVEYDYEQKGVYDGQEQPAP